MKPLLPGQVAIAKHDGKICIVVCDCPFRILIARQVARFCVAPQ